MGLNIYVTFNPKIRKLYMMQSCEGEIRNYQNAASRSRRVKDGNLGLKAWSHGDSPRRRLGFTATRCCSVLAARGWSHDSSTCHSAGKHDFTSSRRYQTSKRRILVSFVIRTDKRVLMSSMNKSYDFAALTFSSVVTPP